MCELSAAARPEDLLVEAVAARGELPLVTDHDHTRPPGARTELSARSLATWAAKVAGLLVDEGGLEPGARVYVDLPAHWVTVAVVAGVWVAGLEVVTAPGDGVEVAVVTAGHAGAEELDADEVFVVDPSSSWQLGGLPGLAGTALRDLALDVRPHPDRLPSRLPATPADPALDGVTRADLLARAHSSAAELDLGPGARLGWAGGLGDVTEVVDAVLAPWCRAGSLVLLRGLTGDPLAATVAAERVTRVV